jgi:sensor histidine kinase regulating citrate/malate metabolism
VVADQELFDVESLNSRSSHNLVFSFVAGSVVTFFVSFMVLRATRNRQRGFEPVELLE